jgi:hypothetical protein
MCRSFGTPAHEQVVSQRPARDIDDVAIWLAEVARLEHLDVEADRAEAVDNVAAEYAHVVLLREEAQASLRVEDRRVLERP